MGKRVWDNVEEKIAEEENEIFIIFMKIIIILNI